LTFKYLHPVQATGQNPHGPRLCGLFALEVVVVEAVVILSHLALPYQAVVEVVEHPGLMFGTPLPILAVLNLIV
jgi:hypothetical protein